MSSLTLDPGSPWYSPLDPPFDDLSQRTSSVPIKYRYILTSSLTPFSYTLPKVALSTPNPNQLPCRIENCGKIFASRGNLKRHLINKHHINKKLASQLLPYVQKNDRSFPCPYSECTSEYPRKRDLQRHINVKHLKKPTHPQEIKI